MTANRVVGILSYRRTRATSTGSCVATAAACGLCLRRGAKAPCLQSQAEAVPPKSCPGQGTSTHCARGGGFRTPRGGHIEEDRDSFQTPPQLRSRQDTTRPRTQNRNPMQLGTFPIQVPLGRYAQVSPSEALDWLGPLGWICATAVVIVGFRRSNHGRAEKKG